MIKLYTFCLIVLFSNYIQKINNLRDNKKHCVLLQHLYLIVMCIFNITFNKFDWIK